MSSYQNPALFALTGRHTLPLWDEKLLFTFSLPQDEAGGQSLAPGPARSPYPFRQRRLGNLNPDEAMLLLKEALRDNQAFFIRPGPDPFQLCFPYAYYVPKRGDKITNISTGEIYTVSQVLSDGITSDPLKPVVLLSGKRPPKESDRLRFDPQNEIVFNHAFPRLFAKGQKFSEEGSVGDKPEPWNDAITYLVTRSEPGTVGASEPFEGRRQMRPQFREERDDPLDPSLLIETQGWVFDTLIRFDCWAKQNADAVRLLNWFEDFVHRHTWILEAFGVQRVWYWGRDEDSEVRKYRDDATKRSVVYYLRTERIFTRSLRKVGRIDLEILVDVEGGPVPESHLQPLFPEPSLSVPWPEPSTSIEASFIESPKET